MSLYIALPVKYTKTDMKISVFFDVLILQQEFTMNISKNEQRTLHVLAQGGKIIHIRNEQGKISKVECYNRDGFMLVDCTLEVFIKLKSKHLISSKMAETYQINMKVPQKLSALKQITDKENPA